MGGVRVEKVMGGADVTQHIFSHCGRKKRKSRTGGRWRCEEADTRLRRISGRGEESGPHRVGEVGGGRGRGGGVGEGGSFFRLEGRR